MLRRDSQASEIESRQFVGEDIEVKLPIDFPLAWSTGTETPAIELKPTMSPPIPRRS